MTRAIRPQPYGVVIVGADPTGVTFGRRLAVKKSGGDRRPEACALRPPSCDAHRRRDDARPADGWGRRPGTRFLRMNGWSLIAPDGQPFVSGHALVRVRGDEVSDSIDTGDGYPIACCVYREELYSMIADRHRHSVMDAIEAKTVTTAVAVVELSSDGSSVS